LFLLKPFFFVGFAHSILKSLARLTVKSLRRETSPQDG
jgi:hypothetical protein